MTDLTARLKKRAMELSYDNTDLPTAKLVTEAADEIDRFTGEVSQYQTYAEEVTNKHKFLKDKADALAKRVEYYTTHMKTAVSIKELAVALAAYQNKEIIQGEVGKEIVG